MNFKFLKNYKMKKLLLVATFAVAGVTGNLSAKGTAPKNETDKKSETKKEVVTKEIKTSVARERLCGVYYASCTAAYTCQDWSAAQWIAWGDAIQENYCQL